MTVWPNILSGLILVQTVCKGYQQMTKAGKELNNVERDLKPRPDHLD